MSGGYHITLKWAKEITVDQLRLGFHQKCYLPVNKFERNIGNNLF